MTLHLRATRYHLPYGMTHSVTCIPTQVNTPRLNPSQKGRYSIYLPPGMEGWVDLGDRLHNEMVYPTTDGHPSKY